MTRTTAMAERTVHSDIALFVSPQLDGASLTLPSLFVGGSRDPVLALSPPDAMTPWLRDHRGTVLVDGAGHWVQQEGPDEVNAALLHFLRGLDLGTGGPG